MVKNNFTPPQIFLQQARFPVNLIMTRSAVFTASQIAEVLSMSPQKKYAIEVAVEEAFTNAVQHFSKETLLKERIHIRYTIENGYLVISIKEKGIPFDLLSSERFNTDSLEGMDKSGLGTFLIEKMMDSVEFIVHGRKGKETRMKLKISNSAIPPELLPHNHVKTKKQRQLVTESFCREASRNDLPEICRLAWKCYGYTHEELLYNIDLLTEKFDNGEVIPIVFFDSASKNMIAHEAFKYHNPEVKVPELSLAFIDPSYRCPNLTRKFAEEALRISRKNGDSGFFDCSVTTHIYSQKGAQEYLNSSPCAIIFAIAAAGMKANELSTVTQEKGSIVNHYHAFDKSRHTVYIPSQHRAIIEKIYSWLELPRDYILDTNKVPVGESSIINIDLPDELNTTIIIVNRIGADTVNEIKEALSNCKAARKDAVYLYISSESVFSPYLVRKSEEMGFSFAGIMPHVLGGGDQIMLQYLNITIDYNNIKVYGKRSAELLAYSISERERIDSL